MEIIGHIDQKSLKERFLECLFFIDDEYSMVDCIVPL